MVRGNYDTLTLKLQDNLDHFEKYAEKSNEATFFTQLVCVATVCAYVNTTIHHLIERGIVCIYGRVFSILLIIFLHSSLFPLLPAYHIFPTQLCQPPPHFSSPALLLPCPPPALLQLRTVTLNMRETIALPNVQQMTLLTELGSVS